MPQQGITFDGAYISLPGAYYADDVSAGGLIPPPTTPPLLYLGYGWGPKPKVPVTFTNPQDLLNALRGAPASDYVSFMTNPSPAVNGAQLITFIDVSENTQAVASLSASGALGTQTLLSSVLYGPPSNLMTYQVLAGTTAGRKLIIFDQYSNSTLVGDNLTVPFSLGYSGAATGGVTYTVTSASMTLSSPIAGESLMIPIGSGQYTPSSNLVEYINGTSNFFAQSLSSTNGQLPSNFLTATGSVALPIPSSGNIQYVNVNAYLQDMAFWVNQFASTLASATVSGSALDVAGWLPVVAPPTFFSGARGIPPTNSDYASGLTVALSTPAWAVFCDSNGAAVQALLASHCEIASSAPNGAWRRGFTGSSIGDSISFTETASIDLDSIQMVYAYPGIYKINTVTGQNQLYSGLHVAAAAAGIATGNQIALPITNKVLNGTGVELVNAGNPLTPSQLTALQNNGVLAIYVPQATKVPTFLSDVTTWEADDNVENTSTQQVACRYWLAYTVVNSLQPYVGTIAAPLTEVSIINAVRRALNGLIYTGGSSNGVLASWDTKSLQLIYTGSQELAAVTFNAVLVGQNRIITAFASILPLNFSITAS